MDDIYNSARIGHIQNIMGHHAEMAAPGETIYFGLTDDPCQPMTYRNADSRPSGVIQGKEARPDGTFDIRVKLDDGTYRSVNTGTLAPGDLFEYGEDAYARYAEKRAEEKARAEQSILKEPEYSGAGDLAEQVKYLSSRLEDHIQQTQNQNATFVETIAQMANDISTGRAEFSNVFRKEFATFKGTEESEPTPAVSEREYGDVSAVIESSDEDEA